MSQTESQQHDFVKGVYNYAAHLLVNQKKSKEEVRTLLVDKGIDEDSVLVIIDSIEKKIIKAKKDKSNKDMLFGGLWCVGGIVVSVVTYSAASGGGTYVVAWGAIVFGLVQFIRGLISSQS